MKTRFILPALYLLFGTCALAFAEVNAEKVASSIYMKIPKNDALIYRASAIVIEQTGNAVSPEMREKLFEVIKNNLASSEKGHDMGQYNRKVLEVLETRGFRMTVHLVQKTKDYYINAWLQVTPADLWYNLAKRPPETFNHADIIDLKDGSGYEIESITKTIEKYQDSHAIPNKIIQFTVYPETIFELDFLTRTKDELQKGIKPVTSPNWFTPKTGVTYFDIPTKFKSYRQTAGFEDNEAKPLLRDLIGKREGYPPSPYEWSGYGTFPNFPLVPKSLEHKTLDQDGSEKLYWHCQLLDVTIGEDARNAKSINDYLRPLNIFGYSYSYTPKNGKETPLPIENLKRQLEAE